MCGIAGALSFPESAFRISEAYVTTMRDTLSHRGPDSAGTWIAADGSVGLGACRLRIIDLSPAAEQPMANEDGSVRLVFNGEIYNHAALRRELERGGHRFRSDHSDTEVIVHAFEEWGIECLQRFRGMFAIALWDAREDVLWLARDRIGIKPLYYSTHHGRFVFASEIKALLSDPEQPRVLDPEALFHYLSFLTAPAPLTLFAGIRKVPAGTWVRVGAGGAVATGRYWDVWDHTDPIRGVEADEIAARVLEELRTSVQLRKISDVPVGIFLSGGVDSSANAALFANGSGEAVRTFTIGYEGDNPSYANEFRWAERMAREVGAEHHERLLSRDELLAFLPELVRLHDEPIADPVAVPLYFVSELARRHGVIVCQAGEGADELFLGYPSWRTLLRLDRANELPVPNILKRAALGALRGGGASRTRPYEFLRRGSRHLPIFWGGAEAFTEDQKRRLLSPRLRREVAGLSSWDVLRPIHERFHEKAWEPSPLHWMTYLDLNLRLPELLLARIDRMSMGVSVEVRVPFLDHRLVELALSIPQSAKTDGGTLKAILRKALRGVVPDELLDRPKQGFRVPIEWFDGAIAERTRRELLEFCSHADVLDRREVQRVLRRPRRESWYLLNLALWWKEYVAC
jgi:asparagine synthase (glutamine-hydrolysing)